MIVRMSPTPIQEGFLPEENGHSVYYAQYGNLEGLALLVFHGGPGSKSSPKYIKDYNLKSLRVITFDQRGCGKSLPLGNIDDNTTQKVIDDVERLRELLGIETWVVAGGSWGATLALLYAQKYPKRVQGLLLSSVFLGRTEDEEWAFTKEGGVERMFPDVWEKRIEFLTRFGAVPANAAHKLLDRLLAGDEPLQKEIVVGVINWEANLASTQENIYYISESDVSAGNIASTKVFLHYEMHDYFLEVDQVMRDVEMIRSIRTVIVHGRFDVICPPDGAWSLSKKLDNVKVIFLASSAHRFTAEASTARALVFNTALKEWLGL